MAQRKEKQSDKPSEKICLFGGTFDPIHLGHIHIASEAVAQLGLDRIIFLPCQQSPHKTGQQHAEAIHRHAMCELAAHSFDWAEVDDHDLTTPPPSYSWKTAQAMRKRFPDARLFWLMGTDQWEALPRWDQPDKLSHLVEFIVFARGEEPTPRQGYRMHAMKGDHPASATQIRQSIRGHDTPPWLHPEVAQYIKSHKLYENHSVQESPSNSENPCNPKKSNG